MAEETQTEPTKGRGRQALISKPELVELVWAKATFDKSGRATGFPAIMSALLSMKSFKEGKKDEKYVKRYAEGRIRRLMAEGIPMPVFTDIPVEEKPKSLTMLALEKAQAAMAKAGVQPEVIASHADSYLGTDRRKSGGRREGDK